MGKDLTIVSALGESITIIPTDFRDAYLIKEEADELKASQLLSSATKSLMTSTDGPAFRPLRTL